MFMDKPQEEQQVEKKIGQLQNRQKILLNKKTQRGTPGQDAPADWTRGHFGGRFPRCRWHGGRGSQGIPDCPLPPARGGGAGGKSTQKRGCGVIPSPNGALIHRPGVVRPAGGCCVLRTRWGLTPPNLRTPLRQFFIVLYKSSSGARASPPWPLPHIGAANGW